MVVVSKGFGGITPKPLEIDTFKNRLNPMVIKHLPIIRQVLLGNCAYRESIESIQVLFHFNVFESRVLEE